MTTPSRMIYPDQKIAELIAEKGVLAKEVSRLRDVLQSIATTPPVTLRVGSVGETLFQCSSCRTIWGSPLLKEIHILPCAVITARIALNPEPKP